LESARHGIGQLEGQVLGQLTEMTGREYPGGGPDDTDDNTRGTLVGQRDRGTLKGGSWRIPRPLTPNTRLLECPDGKG